MIITSPVNKSWNQTLRQPRVGILLHYDDSSSDTGALGWLTKDPRCGVSYNVLVEDDGIAYQIAPLTARAWHAGVCYPSDPAHPYVDANSAFYGVAVSARDGEVVTPLQMLGVVRICRELAARHNWDLAMEPWRITGHDREAATLVNGIWKRGRKIDPTGSNKDRPVLSVEAVRAAFQSPAPPAAA